MIPSERIRELEIQIHNRQPYLDRIVVCLQAITTYLDEEALSKVKLAESTGSTDTPGSGPPSLPPIVFPSLPLKPGDSK